MGWPFALSVLAAMTLPGLAAAGEPSWDVVKPSNTGVPGEEVRIARFDAEGDLWVAARWPFWGEAGLARWNAEANTWTVWSNWETPIPSPFINDFAFGPDGVIWIATGGGLVKKNGDSWTVYTTANAPFLHNTIMNLDVEPGGVVWLNNSNVQTVNGAIFRLDDSDPGAPSWTMFTINNGLPWAPPWGALSDVIVDRQGSVWVGNQTLNGVAKYDGKNWTLHGGGVGRFGKLLEDTEGNIWLKAGVGGGNSFWKFNGSSFTHFPVPTTPTTMAVDDDGAVYLGDWSGTVRKTINGGANWTTFASIGTQVFNIAPDPRSTDVWLGSPGAVRHHNGAGVWQKAFNSYNTGMPWYWVNRFNVDPQGNVWVATGEAGLSRYDGERWRNWGNHNAGAEPYPFAGNEPMGAFFMDSTGTGWMGGNGIARWVPATGVFTGFWNWQNNPGMGVTMFTHFAEDMHGSIFAATQYGTVFRYNPQTNLWQNVQQIYAVSGLPGMVSDPQGNIWLAGWFDIRKWDGANWTTIELPYADYFFDLGGMNCIAIGPPPGDILWLGTGDGLVRYDGATFTRYHTGNSPIPAKQVQGVSVRSDGLIGLSAYTFSAVTPFPNGVAIIDGDIDDADAWQVFTYADSPLTHYQLGDVRFDADGRLWISCLSEGAVVLTPAASTANPGDLNGDGAVDVQDLLILLSAWGQCPPPDKGDCPADLNGSGAVDVQDLLILLANWG